MIELHTWTTPNGYKPLILLEELAVPYRVVAVDLSKNQQQTPAFLALNPNGKIPALLDMADDAETVHVFESGAILIYLAEKFAQFLPTNGQARADTLTWLMLQMGGVGPMMGQWGHFLGAKREDAYALERYAQESKRILGVLDQRLATQPYLAGEYSIADMATYPWIAAAPRFGLTLEAWPNLERWCKAIAARPAVSRAMAWKP